MNNILVIFGYNRELCKLYLSEHDIISRYRSYAIISKYIHLQGLRNYDILFLDGWWGHINSNKILCCLEQSMRIWPGEIKVIGNDDFIPPSLLERFNLFRYGREGENVVSIDSRFEILDL